MTYVIRCEVSGGVTGYRTALAKRDGAVLTYETREDAEAVARQWTQERNGNPYRTADFRYTAEER